MRVLGSFKWCLTSSFITQHFPWLRINKPTLHSYRELNPEQLTKRCRNGYIGPPKMFWVSSVSIEVQFGLKSGSGVAQISVQPLFRISRSTTGPFTVGCELRFWVCQGVEGCALGDLDHIERLGANGPLWHVGPCGRGMYYASHNALPHRGTPTVGPCIWSVSV